MTITGFALSGGGAKGAAQVGMLVALEERGIIADVVAGCSVGSINGLALAQYGSAAKLKDLWMDLNNDMIRKRWRFGILRGFFKGSKYDSSALREYLTGKIKVEALRESRLKLVVGAVNVSTGQPEIALLTGKDVPNAKYAIDWVMRSSAMPMGLSPEYDEKKQMYLDWGLREITPVVQVRKMGADKIYVLQCGGDGISPYDEGSRMDKLALRCVDIMSNETKLDDLRAVEAWNAAIRASSPEAAGKHLIDYTIIQPLEKLPGDSLDFSPELVRARYDIGYRSAIKILNSL